MLAAQTKNAKRKNIEIKGQFAKLQNKEQSISYYFYPFYRAYYFFLLYGRGARQKKIDSISPRGRGGRRLTPAGKRGGLRRPHSVLVALSPLSLSLSLD